MPLSSTKQEKNDRNYMKTPVPSETERIKTKQIIYSKMIKYNCSESK